MSMTAKDREFLEAVAQDKLPRYDSLAALRRAACRLIRQGLLEARLQDKWTCYRLTQAGRDRLAGERPRGVNPFDRAVPTLAQQTQYMIDAVNAEHKAG